MNSNGESAVETCEENVVVEWGKQCELLQHNETSAVAGMISASDSVSKNAVCKALPGISDESISDDNVAYSKSEGRRVLEGHHDCFSWDIGADEHAKNKSEIEDSRIKYGGINQISAEISDKMPYSSSPTGLSSQHSGLLEIPPSKSIDDATVLHCIFSHASNGICVLHNSNSRDIEDDKPSDTKGEFLEASTDILNSLLTTELASDIASGDPPAPDLNPIEKKDDMEVEIQPIDEIDESDMVEHDVEVCDICGDCGREQLLATCCRCSDGAEHTYCMREMLDKVPDGDWMCEECKSIELVTNERPEKIGIVDQNEIYNSSGQESSEYVNSSDIERLRTRCCMSPGKRLRDDADAEVSSIVKKPSLDSTVGSPKTSSSSKTGALSCENSTKNLDKGRLLSSHHSSFDTVLVNDTPESAQIASNLRVQNFRGTLNSLNSKPKVKLVDQVVLQRQISTSEHAFFGLKESSRSIGKSIAFKSMNSGHSETKVKTLSLRLSHIQDIKSAKQRSSFERHSSLKIEHPSINSIIGTSGSSTPRIDKKPASWGESSSLTTITNRHEVNPVQNDGKSAALSRSSCLASRRNADLSSSLGEFKRPMLLHGHSTLGVSSTNGPKNTEQKSKKTSPKEEDFSSSVISERPSFNGWPDGSSQSRDFANSGERMREYSGDRFQTSSVKSSRDEGDILKAAIEAAVLRKPGLYRKHRGLGQSDSSSVSNLPERRAVSQHLKDEFLKQETLNKANLISLVPVESLSSGGGDAVPIVLSDENSSLRDALINVQAAMPFFLKTLAIPAHEYIWQGSFEICRSGKIFDSWDGIQAHMSRCASPKVIEAVNKFKSRIILYEVPRLSTWPLQFQEHGVREDNIALFFFAKDLESYAKIYKFLLDNMMKNDLALKGNFNGVELLIFPSNKLPDNFQRWNTLFFLWGVFRGKKESCSQHMPESLEQFKAPQDMHPAIVSLPQNRCSLRPIGDHLPASEHAAPSPEVLGAEDLCSSLPSRTINGDCNTKISSLDQPDGGLILSSTVAVESDSAKQCQGPSTTSLEGGITSSCKPAQQAESTTESSGREQMLRQLDALLDRQHTACNFSNSTADTHDMEGTGDRTILDRRTCNQDLVKSKMVDDDLSSNGETPLKKDRESKYPNIEHNRWLLNVKECLHLEPCVVPQTLNPGTSPVLPGNDDDTREKMNHVATGSCGALENRHHEAPDEICIPEYNENAERHSLPVETQPVMGVDLFDRSIPRRMHPLERKQAS